MTTWSKTPPSALLAALMATQLTVACACGDEPTPRRGDAGTRSDAGTLGDTGTLTDARVIGPRVDVGAFDAGPRCTPPAPPGAEVVFSPEFAPLYAVYELGPPPSVPNPLGGTVILRDHVDELLIVGASEYATGAIYRVPIRRDACGHIVGFEGSSTRLGDAPYADANLLQTSDGASLLYTGWSVSEFSQWSLTTYAPLWTVSLPTLGLAGDSAGGFGQVPRALPGRGGYRIVGWPDGRWHEFSLASDAGTWSVTGVTYTGTALSRGPGGFAYVPAGSPGFPRQSIILAEWSVGSVAVYEVDDDGNPEAASRRDFFSSFPRPWGAYFEPETGDFLFLTWGRPGQPDSLFVVQGFERPEEPI